MPVPSFIAHPPFQSHIMTFPPPTITFIHAPDTGVHINSIRRTGHAESLLHQNEGPRALVLFASEEDEQGLAAAIAAAGGV